MLPAITEDQLLPAAPEKGFRVKAIWKTLQGEGLFAGRPAVFVRLVGCNLWSGYEKTRQRDAQRTQATCPLWCDTDFTKENSQVYSATELARAMREVGGEITRNAARNSGSEPNFVTCSVAKLPVR